jgi:hypothetical protein
MELGRDFGGGEVRMRGDAADKFLKSLAKGLCHDASFHLVILTYQIGLKPNTLTSYLSIFIFRKGGNKMIKKLIAILILLGTLFIAGCPPPPPGPFYPHRHYHHWR